MNQYAIVSLRKRKTVCGVFCTLYLARLTPKVYVLVSNKEWAYKFPGDIALYEGLCKFLAKYPLSQGKRPRFEVGDFEVTEVYVRPSNDQIETKTLCSLRNLIALNQRFALQLKMPPEVECKQKKRISLCSRTDDEANTRLITIIDNHLRHLYINDIPLRKVSTSVVEEFLEEGGFITWAHDE